VESPSNNRARIGTMGVMDRFCAACHQPIGDNEQWFRVREDYVHLACSDKYLRTALERRHQDSKSEGEKAAAATAG
jgi:hypothetical protein